MLDTYPFDIDSDPAPDLQLVHTAAVNEANRLSAVIAARKAYAAMQYRPNRLPPRPRHSHIALLGLAFLLFGALTLVCAGLWMLVRAILVGVKP